MVPKTLGWSPNKEAPGVVPMARDDPKVGPSWAHPGPPRCQPQPSAPGSSPSRHHRFSGSAEERPKSGGGLVPRKPSGENGPV